MQASNSAGHVFGDVLRVQYVGLEFTEHDCRVTANICRRPTRRIYYFPSRYATRLL
jgi:hypothetical protein